MDKKQITRAKRWNERLRLIITFFNITSIGVFGLSVTAPILEHMKFRNSLSSMSNIKLWGAYGDDATFSLADVIAWEAAGAALALHVFAHILVGLTELEE